jgi:hypothetical protein
MWVHSTVLLVSLLFSVHLFLNESQIYSLLTLSNLSADQVPFNNYCKSNFAEVDEIVCNGGIKKPNYIWLLLDALASFQTGDLSTAFNSSHFLHIQNKAFPQSSAIISTHFLGRNSRNYVGALIQEDTIIDQFDSNSTQFVSSKFPTFNLLGESRFVFFNTYKSREAYPMSKFDSTKSCKRLFKFPYENSRHMLSPSEASKIVTSLSQNYTLLVKPSKLSYCMDNYSISSKLPKNLLVYTSIMDSFNHNYSALSQKTISRAAGLVAVIKSIVKYLQDSGLDKYYSLIVSSDHGGQWTTKEDEICNHGCKTSEGNEPFLYIWNKDIPGHYEDWISVEQVAPTIAQLVRGAGIPLRATGYPQPLDISETSRYIVYRTKEIQLISYYNMLNSQEARRIDRIQDMTISADNLNLFMSQLIEIYPKYLEELENEINILERPRYAIIISNLIGLAIGFAIWVEIRDICTGKLRYIIAGIALLVSNGRILVAGDVFIRVEQAIRAPIMILQGVLVLLIYWKFITKTLRDIITRMQFRNIRNTASILISSKKYSTKAWPTLILTLNSILLYTSFNLSYTDSFYILHITHYILLVAYTYLDIISHQEPQLSHRAVCKLLFTTLSIISMLWYEFITLDSQTDQTDSMITLIRIFYIFLFLSLILLLSLGSSSDITDMIAYPAVILFFFIADSQQRNFLLVVFLPTVIYI